MNHRIRFYIIVCTLLVLCVLAAIPVPISTAQTATATSTHTPTSTPTATNTPTSTPTNTPTAMPTPTPRPGTPYIFRGRVLDADDVHRPMPEFDIQIACTGAPAVVVRSQRNVQTGQQEWEFDESAHLGPGTLPLTTTCDVELQLPPGAGYQAVRAIYRQLDPTQQHFPTIVSATHFRYEDFSPDTYATNDFEVAKPMTTTDTAHFSIEWYTDRNDPDYPRSGGTGGLDYIRVVSDTLEAAWATYESLDYRMPPPTPGRSDDLITVLVEAEPFMVSVYPLYASGASYGGRIWIRNNLDTTGGSTDSFLAHVAAHELFHLVQYNYLGYTLDVGLELWTLHNLFRLSQRDLWLLESTAQWAPGEVYDGLKAHGNDLIKAFYDDLEYSLPYSILGQTDRQYGAVVFPLFLQQHRAGGSPDIVREMWEEIESDPGHPFAQIDDLAATYGSTLDETFADFSIANYLYADYYAGSAQWDPRVGDDIVDRSAHEHHPEMRETESGTGEAYALGTTYVRIVDDDIQPPFDPDADNILRIDLTARKAAWINEIANDDLKVQLLMLEPGADAVVLDVTSELETDVWDLKWTLETDVPDFGNRYEEVVLLVINTARPVFAGLRWFSSLAHQPRIDFDYTIELTHPDNEPPQVDACIVKELTGGALVYAEADDAQSRLAQIQIRSTAPFTLPPGTRSWSQTRFVPGSQLGTWTFSA